MRKFSLGHSVNAIPLLILVQYLSSSIDNVCGFNVDTVNYVKHRGSPGSMFGFSVAAHREQGNSWVLVGAPEAQTSQPGVTKGGAVYRCDIGRDDACALIDFDLKGNINNSENRQVDQKSFQWFGATVKSSGEDGVILACAPRYVWFSTHLNLRDPVGTCYTAKNQFSEFAEYSPCRTRNWGFHRQGSCQAGLGAALSNDGKRMYIGAVGSYYWQGQLHSLDSLAKLPFVPPRIMSILEEGQVISQSSHIRPDVISTRDGPSSDDGSYLGYSVTAGDFGGGSGTNQDAAVGMPRGASLLGKVVIYTWNMTNIQNITGEQLGAYFGYSICSGDMDGDGRDDIAVGAPLYTVLGNNKGHYETGRVYIIYQGTNVDYAFKQLDVRDGVNSKGRFGLSLAYLGDINLDGFGDLVIGAPYDGPKERGAVYIYHGSERGVMEKPSQIIHSEQVVGQPSTFGFSLAGGLDLDENLYPDLIIGAYDSDTAVFMRSRPVVQVDSTLSFVGVSKQISLEEKNCTLRDKTRVACTEISTCLQYTGTGVDRRIEFEIQFILDVKKPRNPRMFFVSDEGKHLMNQTIRLDKGVMNCKKMFVYITPNIRDKLTPLEVEMKYSLKSAQSATQRRVSRFLAPILDMNKELVRRDSLVVQKECGPDNVCIPDLRLIATSSVTRYLLGSGEKLVINVLVQNEGEDAYEAVYEMQIPNGLNFVKIERLDESKEIHVLCSPPSYLNNNTLHCDIGNPLPKEKLVQFQVLLQPYRLEGLKPRYELRMNVNSTNPERDGSLTDNQMDMRIPIWVETELILKGSSHGEVFYNATNYENEAIEHESQIGPQVTHVYSIMNKGPSDIIEAEAYFLWPSYTLSGDHLLYLLEQPDVSGNAKCEIVEEVNVENIKLERRNKAQPLEGSVTSGLVSESGHSLSSSSGSSYSSSSSFSSSSSSGSSGSWHGKQGLTLEERRRLEEAARRRQQEEDIIGEGGDGSDKHRHRITQTYYETNTGDGGNLDSGSRVGAAGQGYNRSWSSHSSWQSGGGRDTGSGGSVAGSSGTGYNRSWTSESSWTSNNNRDRIGAGASSGVDESRDNRQGGQSETSYSHSSGASRGSSSGTSVSSDGGTRVSQSAGGTYRGSSSETTNSEGSYYGSGASRGSSSSMSTESGVRVSQSGSGSSYRGTSSSGTGHSEGSYFSGGRGTSEEHISRGTWNTDSEGGHGSSSRGETSHSHSVQPDRRYEERNYERNTTWSSAGDRRQPHVSTGWSTSRDESSHHGNDSGGHDVENREGESYFGLDKNKSTPWMTTDGGRNRGQGHSGDRNRHTDYSEERHVHRNTSWSSGGRPITSEHSSWSVSEDGTIKNGSSSRVYQNPGIHIIDNSDLSLTADNRKPLDISIDGSVDRNIIGAGGTRFYSEERGSEKNSSWSSGRRPVVHESSHWKVNADGKVTNGSTFRVYDSEEGYDHSRNSGHHREGNYNKEVHSSREESSSSLDSGSRRQHMHSGHEKIATDRNGSRRQEGSSLEHGGRRTEDNVREEEGSSRSRGATNINISDLLNSRRSSHGSVSGSSSHEGGSYESSHSSSGSSFDFGTIAQGPRDGKANTYSLDIGMLNPDGSEKRQGGTSVSSSYDNRERHVSSGSGSRYGSQEYSGASRGSGGSLSSSSSHYSSRGSGGGSSESSVRHYSSGSHGGGFSARHNEDDGSLYDSGSSDHNRQGSSYSRTWSYSSGTADGDSIGHGGMYNPRPDSHDESRRTRYRRQVDDMDDLESSLNCGPTKCTKIRCVVSLLKKDEEAIFTFKSRVWVQTLLKQLASDQSLNVSSQLVARVSKLPYIGRPDVIATKTHEVFTPIIPRTAAGKTEVVPLWIVVLSACAGALLLMLLVYLLYKCGFFKRNRPSASPEKQPLNRNGHYHSGDEAL